MEGTSKSVLIKSKSSNTALRTSKTKKRTNKKSKSYGQFEPSVLKKRGVYVEKNNMNSLIENNIRGNRSPTLKKNAPAAPPRPRPGSKKFLNSVLAILSQTTISTQFPVNEDKKPKKKKEKLETKSLIKELSEETTLVQQGRTKKNKFRSKILNETKDEPLVLLRPRKELGQTSSSFSQRSSRWSMSGFRTAIDNKQSNTLIQNALESDNYETGSIAKEVMAGRNVIKKVPSPLTLVNDNKLKEPIKDEKKLYNFFVDLLETTFSVYNVTPEYDVAAVEASDVSSSKMALEIDELVAQKLNIENEQKVPVTRDVQQKLSYNLDDSVQWNDKKVLEYFQSHTLSSIWSKSDIPQTKSCRRKIKSGAFLNSRTTNRPGESRSAEMSTKKPLNKKRKNLLNMLKEQLTEVRSFEEPTTFYQALKVMAKNKRKSQKSIQFAEPSRKLEGSFDSTDCMFKRRRVLSNSTKSYRSKAYKRAPRTPSSSSGSELSFRRKKPNDFNSPTDCEADDESCHSLEVYGYDYEPSVEKRYIENQNKRIDISGNIFDDFDYDNSVQVYKQNLGQ